MKIKTSELEGAALDWAAGSAVKHKDIELGLMVMGLNEFSVYIKSGKTLNSFSPSTCWQQCGPLIEKYKVSIVYHNAPDRTPLAVVDGMHPHFESGCTVLIAACRAIVASQLGDEVDVPEELA